MTELRLVSDDIGYGVFATEFIPQGTIVYVQDPLEIVVSSVEYTLLNVQMQQMVEKYSYISSLGDRILSWDFGKYVNHRCDCNTMSTGWGFEIALRDIRQGEEITDDYGLFNLEYDMPVSCGCNRCRKFVRRNDIDMHYRAWDEKIQHAMARVMRVEQPLLSVIDADVWASVTAFSQGRAPYISVMELKHEPCEEKMMVS
ncbi:hypothetical protein NT6N_15750 [Oceaniferula spumae]|uniref:SET domain-containing protein n=1 Tax=Oceaniferula spumae TaxID=2979115 RepID=A0AAT9FKK6_9BACT